jgi:hypothetical protein
VLDKLWYPSILGTVDKIQTEGGPMKRQWFVGAIARKTGHHSKQGPFDCPLMAAQFIIDLRPVEDWKMVLITSIVKES